MPIDAEKLLNFAIPRGRQTLAAHDIAFYALSVGMGRDPLDETQLDFVDPLRGPAFLPSMALVLAHPGFWLAHPDSGVDPACVLHAGQAFEILNTPPLGGMIESETKITGLIDKGAGKSALLETDTDLFDGSGRVFAKLARTTFIR